MGLLFVGLAKLMKAKIVSIIDFNSKRLKVAKALGANYIFKSSKNMKASLEKKILNPKNFRLEKQVLNLFDFYLEELAK